MSQSTNPTAAASQSPPVANPSANPTATAPAAVRGLAPTPKTSSGNTRNIARGSAVSVVSARGEHIEARVISYSADKQLLEVEFEYQGETQRITKSPYDPSGTKPDSWHWPN